jgi:fumarate hydratase class I
MTTTTIRQEDLIESIAGALQYITGYSSTDTE